MPVLNTSLVMETLATSSSSSSSFPPFLVFVAIIIAVISSLVKSMARKKRAQPRSVPQLPTAGPAHAKGARAPAAAPYMGTLLNGVPIANYDSSHGSQAGGFANERMRAEAELKRQLDALDAARRAGQVTAEDYAAYREGIFKNF